MTNKETDDLRECLTGLSITDRLLIACLVGEKFIETKVFFAQMFLSWSILKKRIFVGRESAASPIPRIIGL